MPIYESANVRLVSSVTYRPRASLVCHRKTLRRGDDFVTRADAEQHQRDVQRGRAAVESDAMLRAAEFREILFKLCHVRPEAKGTIVEGARDGGVKFRAEAADLCGQIEVGNFDGHDFFNIADFWGKFIQERRA
jgi:hypothetical protein